MDQLKILQEKIWLINSDVFECWRMMMEYSFDLPEMNNLINTISNILKKGFRTRDIADKSDKILGTQEIGDLLISELEIK